MAPSNVLVPGWATQVTLGRPGSVRSCSVPRPVEIPAGQPHAGDLLIATYGWDNRAIEDGGGSFSAHEYVKLVRFARGPSTIFPIAGGSRRDGTSLLPQRRHANCRFAEGGTVLQLVAKRSRPRVERCSVAWSGSHGGDPRRARTWWNPATSRYMDPTYCRLTGYCLSTDNGLTFGPDIDPFDGTVGLSIIGGQPAGQTSTERFADTPDPNVVRTSGARGWRGRHRMPRSTDATSPSSARTDQLYA